MNSPLRPNALFAALIAAGLSVGATSLMAQNTGTIQGEVREAGSLRPLSTVQVFAPESGRGTLTNAAGRYVLVNVPAGQVRLQAQGVGFATQTQTVTVNPGETIRVDFNLQTSAIALDEVVVTGTGAPAARRTLGHTLASVDAAELENRPIANVSQVLQGREPGVQALNAGGMTGQGTRIRIRGSSSLSQGNSPVVYIDGVRVDVGAGTTAGDAGRTSRLDDLNPDAIERIEILKGAAAATLYGTEASNGVIQIFTKRGQSGDPRWSYSFEQSFMRYPTERWAPHAGWARNQAQADHLVQHWGLAPGLQPYEVFEVQWIPQIFETGRANVQTLSVSGGSQGVTYFVSGRFANENGPFGGTDLFAAPGFEVAQDIERARQANVNLTMFPVERLRLRATGMYIERYNSTPGQGNSTAAPYSMAMMAQPWRANENNLGGTSAFQTVREGMLRQNWWDVQRFGGSIGANFEPIDRVNLDAVFGVDVVNQMSFTHVPFGYNVDNFTGTDVTGRKIVADRNRRDLTLDVKANWAETFGSLSSTFVVGSQVLMNTVQTTGAEGWDFPAPGLTVAQSAANRTNRDAYSAAVSAGVFAQEQIGYNDWAFLTLGARYDKHSAFGETAGGALYPKVSVSLVPTDMPGWRANNLISSMQLRGAIGTSGLQPDAFDKFTTYTANRSMYGAGIQPQRVGNPDLKPEVSTEWEAGTTIGFFDNRFSFDGTYWNRNVQDLIVERQFSPSGGFLSSQADNIGSMRAQGLELGVKGTLLQTSRVTVNPYVNASYLYEQITSMGEAPPIKTATTVRYLNWHRPGYAPAAFFGPVLADLEYPISLTGGCFGTTVREPATREQLLAHFANPDPARRSPESIAIIVEGCGTGTERDNYLGKPNPDWTGSFGTDITFLNNFRLGAQFEYKFGNYQVHDLMTAFRRSHVSLGRNIRSAAEIESILANPATTPEQRLDAALRWAREVAALSPYDGMNEVKPGDLLRFREANLTYSAPGSLAERLRVRTMDFNIAARNIHLWTKFDGLDPENNVEGGGAGGSFVEGIDSWGLALPRRLSLSVRLGF